MKRAVTMFLTLALLLGCAGCGKFILHYDDAWMDKKPTVIERIFGGKTEKKADRIEPLTGERSEVDVSENRPYAVMINNISVAQPQVGISQADWIYEIPAEGGITRMMALFSHIENVPNVGSIRSLRPYYLSIALSYDAIVIHGGGSEDAYSDLEMLHADHIDGVRDDYAFTSLFYRDMSRASAGTEHTLFFNGDKVPALVEEYGFCTTHNSAYKTGLTFSGNAAEQGTSSAGEICVTFNNSKSTNFTYNSDYNGAGGFYTAAQYGSEYADGGSGEVVPFANVLILQTAMRAYDDYGRLEADVVGSGAGWFFTGGKCVPIHWSRSGTYEPFQYTTESGEPVVFSVGKTYAAVIPADTGSVAFS